PFTGSVVEITGSAPPGGMGGSRGINSPAINAGVSRSSRTSIRGMYRLGLGRSKGGTSGLVADLQAHRQAVGPEVRVVENETRSRLPAHLAETAARGNLVRVDAAVDLV